MRLISFVTLGYFCFNQAILTSSFEIGRANISDGIFRSKEIQACSNMDNKTQLIDLNVDCLLLVLQRLDLVSLMSVAESNHNLKSIVSITLEQMLRNKMVIISLRRSYRQSYMDESDNVVEIQNFAIAEQMLTNFGHLIRILSIDHLYEVTIDETSLIYKLVNVHCSKSLAEITLVNSRHYFLEEFTNRFENVDTVNVRIALRTDRRLNEIFPSVRRLSFSGYGISNSASINVNYPQLEHLHVYIRNENSSWVTQMIRKNSHIQSLSLERTTSEVMRSAVDSLPELEKLTLLSMACKYDNEPITFASVKVFNTEKSCVNCLFKHIRFGNLEELTTDDLAEIMFKEGGIFATNKNLKNLRLLRDSPRHYLNADTFAKLANTSLEDISIHIGTRLEAENVLQLINNGKALKRLQIDFFDNNTREYTSKLLRNQTSDAWSLDTASDAVILKKLYIGH